jgi:hypothetical protein
VQRTGDDPDQGIRKLGANLEAELPSPSKRIGIGNGPARRRILLAVHWAALSSSVDVIGFVRVTKVRCGGRHLTLVKQLPTEVLPLVIRRLVALKRPYLHYLVKAA